MEWEWDRKNATKMGRYLTEIEGAFVDQALSEYPGIVRVLDVSGGSGRFAIPVRQNGYQVFVTEVRLLPLHILRQKVPEMPCVLVDERVQRLPVADTSVDCVLCIEVFAVAHGTWFWPECYRALRPGGIVVCTTHNARSYKGMLRNLFCQKGRGYDYTASSAEMRSRIRSAGLEIRREQGFSWLPVRRASNSPFVTASAMVEERLRLRRLVAGSPWILTLAQKS